MFLVSVLSDDPSSHLIPTYGEDLLASYSEPDQVRLVNVQTVIIFIINNNNNKADLLPGYSEQGDTGVMSGIDMLR